MSVRANFTGNAWQKHAKRDGIGTGNPANWLVNSKRTRQTGFYDPRHHWRNLFHFSQPESSFNPENYRSIQVFQFKISVKKKRTKESRFDKQQFFFVTWIQFLAFALRENLSNPVLYSTNPPWYLHSFWALFALYEVKLDNKDLKQIQVWVKTGHFLEKCLYISQLAKVNVTSILILIKRWETNLSKRKS